MLWFMGDITGLYLFQVSICKTLEGDELDHPALQGNKGQLDQKDQKVYSEGKTTKIDMKGKTKIVKRQLWTQEREKMKLVL